MEMLLLLEFSIKMGFFMVISVILCFERHFIIKKKRKKNELQIIKKSKN